MTAERWSSWFGRLTMKRRGAGTNVAGADVGTLTRVTAIEAPVVTGGPAS